MDKNLPPKMRAMERKVEVAEKKAKQEHLRKMIAAEVARQLRSKKTK